MIEDKQLNTINSRSFNIYSGILFLFCNYICNCIKMKIKLAIIYHIFTSIVVYKCGKKCYLPSSTKP